MRLPTQPSSAQPAPRRPEGTSVAAPAAPMPLRITPAATVFAIAGFGAIAANRHWNGSTDWLSLAWTGAAAIGVLGLSGVLAQAAFKAFGRSNVLANLTFIVAMTLATTCVVLVKGPAHNLAVTRLSSIWPAGAQFLAKTDPSGPSAKAEHSKSAAKGDPVIRVYHKGEQNAAVQPKGD